MGFGINMWCKNIVFASSFEEDGHTQYEFENLINHR